MEKKITLQIPIEREQTEIILDLSRRLEMPVQMIVEELERHIKFELKERYFINQIIRPITFKKLQNEYQKRTRTASSKLQN